MQKVTYKAENVKTKEHYAVAKAAFDETGKMRELVVYTGSGTESVDPEEYIIVYVFDVPSEEAVEKTVKENKERNDKFKIGR